MDRYFTAVPAEVVPLKFVTVRDVIGTQVCLNVDQISVCEGDFDGSYHVRLVGQSEAAIRLDPSEGERLVGLLSRSVPPVTLAPPDQYRAHLAARMIPAAPDGPAIVGE